MNGRMGTCHRPAIPAIDLPSLARLTARRLCWRSASRVVTVFETALLLAGNLREPVSQLGLWITSQVEGSTSTETVAPREREVAQAGGQSADLGNTRH